MVKKAAYEELEQRVKELKKEAPDPKRADESLKSERETGFKILWMD